VPKTDRASAIARSGLLAVVAAALAAPLYAAPAMPQRSMSAVPVVTVFISDLLLGAV